MYYNGKEGREEPSLITSYNTDEPATYRSAPPRASRVIKATRCDWLLATTNVDFARTLHNFRLTDSIFESVRRLLSWSGQQHTNVLATLRPAYITQLWGVKPGVHTNDFFPIYGRRANKLGHASLTTLFRHSRLTFQPILQENLESPLLRYQPITTAVVTDACLNTRWHHGIYISCLERVARYGSGRDNSVGAMNAELSRPDLLATVQLVRKQA